MLRWCRWGRSISTEPEMTNGGSPTERWLRGGLGGCPRGGGSSSTSSASAGSVFSSEGRGCWKDCSPTGVDIVECWCFRCLRGLGFGWCGCGGGSASELPSLVEIPSSMGVAIWRSGLPPLSGARCSMGDGSSAAAGGPGGRDGDSAAAGGPG